ncbi:hypothetical protein GEV33_001712 [Tenebrio molitor]|uniref:Peptidase S1 domain-containing protein n=1 Tax=Tenebrio molitor TaxID=7067 RepID=A0A8J6HLR7_TENMO|nr:hypothetical protein GEV33_001712 [Tenebrio molitor]
MVTFCGGALFENQWIITAGQCVDDAVLFVITLGSATLKDDDPNRITVATSEYFLHPDYNPDTLENDLGLIKLRMPVTFTDYIRPIAPLAMHELPAKPNLRVIGWGESSIEDPAYSNELQVVEVVSLTNDECRITYGNQIKDKMVCAVGQYNEGPCFGDVGSPLLDAYSKYVAVHEIPVKNNTNSRIIGGFPAHINQFPCIAAISVEAPGMTWFCGGCLYGNQWLITAAQCVDGATQFTIRLGSANLSGTDPNRVTLSTSTYFMHPEYSPETLEHDIALIKLHMPITYTDYVKPIDFLAMGDLGSGTDVCALGWGQTSDGIIT